MGPLREKTQLEMRAMGAPSRSCLYVHGVGCATPSEDANGAIGSEEQSLAGIWLMGICDMHNRYSTSYVYSYCTHIPGLVGLHSCRQWAGPSAYTAVGAGAAWRCRPCAPVPTRLAHTQGNLHVGGTQPQRAGMCPL